LATVVRNARERGARYGRWNGAAGAPEQESLGLELWALRDVEEIKQLRARYARFVDTQDWDAWRELLSEDFRLESEYGVQEGRESVVSAASSALAGGSTVHHVLAPEITITGPDTASGVWAFEEWITLPGDGTPVCLHSQGHCYEQYVRTERGWRITSIAETRTQQGGNHATPDP